MIFTLEQDLNLCEKYKITPEQLMFIKMNIIDPTLTDINTHKAKFMEYSHRFSKLYGADMTKKSKGTKAVIEYNIIITNIKKKIITPLMDKKILLYIDITNSRVDPDMLEINPLWVKDFEIDMYGMPQQLCDVYPGVIRLGDKKFPGRNVSAEQISKEYIRNIKNDPKKHKEVLDLLIWGKETNNLLVGLDKFVKTRFWDTLKELKEEGNDGIGFSSEMG